MGITDVLFSIVGIEEREEDKSMELSVFFLSLRCWPAVPRCFCPELASFRELVLFWVSDAAFPEDQCF